MALIATQNIGTATAGSNIAKVVHLKGCQVNPGRACLWINAPDDSDVAKRADKRALVITQGEGPDLEEPTQYELGKVRGVTEEFTDNISVGWNHLPYDLCLLDTEEYSDNEKFGTKAPLRHVNHIIAVPPGKDFSRLGRWNDTIDYFTTGHCPTVDIVFRADTEEIVSRF